MVSHSYLVPYLGSSEARIVCSETLRRLEGHTRPGMIFRLGPCQCLATGRTLTPVAELPRYGLPNISRLALLSRDGPRWISWP